MPVPGTSTAISPVILPAATTQQVSGIGVPDENLLGLYGEDLDFSGADEFREDGGALFNEDGTNALTWIASSFETYKSAVAYFLKTVRRPSFRDQLKIDYTALTPDPKIVRKSPAILFFNPSDNIIFQDGEGEDYVVTPAIESWMRSLEMLGFDMEYVESVEDFRDMLKILKPDIVALSAKEMHVDDIQKAYKIIKHSSPDTIIVLGGVSAFPEWARYMDYVVVGDGEIMGPYLFKSIQERIFEGGILAGKPGLIPMVNNIGVTRSLETPDGSTFEIKVPFGEQLIFRYADSYVSALADSLVERYQGDSARWQEMFDTEFPLTLKQYGIATSPMPINEDEFDTLFANAPHFLTNEIALMAHRYCSGKCTYCSIKHHFGGRHPSVGKVIEYIEAAKDPDGKLRNFRFTDDLFIQDTAWLNRLLDEIEKRGLDKDFRFSAQSRADRMPEAIVRKMKKLGFRIAIGLETMAPERAENMGKVPKGKGVGYIEKGKEAIRLMAEIAMEQHDAGYDFRRGYKYFMDAVYIIVAMYGENEVAIAKDVRAQLEFLKEIWRDYKYIPFLKYNMRQLPGISDSSTQALSGLLYSQPSYFEVSSPNELDEVVIDEGKTTGKFYMFDQVQVGSMFRVYGIYEPLMFKWPKVVRDLSVLNTQLFSTANPIQNLESIFMMLPKDEEETNAGEEYYEDLNAIRSLLEELSDLQDKMPGIHHPEEN